LRLLRLVSPRWLDLGLSIEQARGPYRQRLQLREELLSYRSPYQLIRLFRHSHGHALFLNDTIQWEGREEVTLNHLMVTMPLSLLDNPQSILILGGGFGLGAQAALQFPSLQSVQIVEIDADVVRLSQHSRCLRKLNGKSLSHPKVQVQVGDAFDFQPQQRYDLIVFDCDISATRQRADFSLQLLLDYLQGLQSWATAFCMRIPIDEVFMEATDQLDGQGAGDDLQRTADLVRAVWPEARLAELLTVYCGRELYVWNLPDHVASLLTEESASRLISSLAD